MIRKNIINLRCTEYNMKKILLLLFLLTTLFAPLYAANQTQSTQTDESAQKAVKYGQYAYNIFVILSAIFAITLFIGLILVAQHYGFKTLKDIILIALIFLAAGFLMFWIN